MAGNRGVAYVEPGKVELTSSGIPRPYVTGGSGGVDANAKIRKPGYSHRS
jgi:hypothetical protein